MNILDKVKEIVAEVCEVEKSVVTGNSSIGDFDTWDSMAQLAILNHIEDVFSISFEPEEIMELEDVNDIVNAIEAKKS